MSAAEKSERPEQDRDLRCQSGPSAKDSVIFSGGDSSKNYGADQQRLQISDLHFWQVPYASNLRLLEDKVQDRGMYLFTISYGGDAMDQRSGVGWFSGWIKIFVIYSWYFKCRILEYLMRGLLRHWTKSSIIPSSKGESVWRNEKPKKRTVSFAADKIAYLIYDHFRVTGSHDSVENYTDLFTIFLRNDDIQEFDSKWDGILLSMTKIPHDDILEGFVKIKNTRVWKTQDRIGIVWPGDSSEKVRTWLSQIENDGEEKYRAGNSK